MADEVQTKILEIEVNYDDALTKIAQYRIEVEKVKEKQKELKNALKEGSISQEEYHKAMESSKLVISQMNNAIGALTKQVSNQIKIQKEQNGSLVQWRAQLSNLTAEYDKLSQKEREGAKGKELRDKINEVTTALKDCEAETQRYYRNVGNYPQAMAPMKEQLDILVAKLREMKASGLDTSPAFKEMSLQAEQLRDSLASTSEENQMSFGKMESGVMGLVAVFATWHTALDGLGIKNEDLNRTITVCMTGITAAATAGKVWNAVQKESALMAVATATKTWLLNTALATKLTAMTALTAATGGATVATTLWNAALYANPLVWLIGLVVAAVAAIYGLVKVFSIFTSGSKARKEALKQEAAALEELHTLHEKALELAAARGASEEERARRQIENLKAEYDAWAKHFEKIKKEYDDDDDEYKEALESKKKAHEDFMASLDDALISLTKIQTEQREHERKEALGEYEYKRTLIREQTKQQIELAKTLLKYNKITKAEYDALVADLNKLQTRKISEVDKAEEEAAKKVADAKKKAASDAAKSAADAAKKHQEEAKKREEDYYKEVEKAQDALLALIKEGLDKQLQAENLSYERGLKALKEKLAKYKSNSEYDVKMRQAINDQIYALTVSHERKVAEFEYSEALRKIKVQEELIQSKLELVKKGTIDELNLRYAAIDEQEKYDKAELQKRIDDGLLTQEEGNMLKLDLEAKYRKQRLELGEQYDQLELDRQRAALQAEIDAMQLAEDERQLKVRDGYERSDEEYARWRERGLAEMDEHQRALLLKAEENAQAELEALQFRGQLSTQTVEEYEAEILAAKQKSAQAQANTNAQIIQNEQAKAQAMKAVTSSLTGLLDTLGESNKAFAKMSKVITLAQIAIDTGKALSAGIASASSVPFPGNLVAIATTVATVLANVATAISTVKSAKFAKGGKVHGPGTGTSDDVPALLSNGEYVMTAEATRRFEPLLEAMTREDGTPRVSKAREVLRTEVSALTSEMSYKEREKFLYVLNRYFEEIENHKTETDIKESLYTQLARQLEVFNLRQEVLTSEHFSEIVASHVQRLESMVEQATKSDEIKETLLSEIRSLRLEYQLTEKTDETIAENVAKSVFVDSSINETSVHNEEENNSKSVEADETHVIKTVLAEYVMTTKNIEEHLKEFVDIISVFKTLNTIDSTLSTSHYDMPAGNVDVPATPPTDNDGGADSNPVKPTGYATGGKVHGPGTGTSDSIPTMLSNGEFVMTAAATKMFEPLLTAMNGIGRGVPMQVVGATDRIETADMLTNSFETAASEIKPVVSVVEITDTQKRVEIIENLDNF